MSTDSELLELELAAKAAGYEIEWVRNSGCHYRCEEEIGREQWCPLDDDGDALRLANKLRLYIGHTMFGCPDAPGTALVGVDPWRQGSAPLAYERFSGPSDQDAATRRAIVRAAAEIGRTMP